LEWFLEFENGKNIAIIFNISQISFIKLMNFLMNEIPFEYFALDAFEENGQFDPRKFMR
jgi:hypothetical protein